MDTSLLSQFTNDYDLVVLMQKLGIALLIGLLIGLERERSKRSGDRSFAGIRTSPLIAMLGFLAALVSSFTTFYIYIAIFVMFGLLVSVSYYFSAKKGLVGGTTEVTFLLIFILGTLSFYGYLLLAAALTVIIIIFLTFKTEFRSFAGKIEEEDVFATIKFAIITLIVLPLLPDKGFGPFEALNPRKIWYMVVLISGINFIGYVLFKMMGTKRGIQLLSILGGIASSTAVTLSFADRSKEMSSLSRNFAAGIILASTIMYPRILIIVFLLDPLLAQYLFLPFFIFTITGVIASFLVWRKTNKDEVDKIQISNPFKVITAIKFGIVFGVILLASSAAQYYFGDRGIYITSFFAGFADMDAIAISITDLLGRKIFIDVATIAIIIAGISNTVVKMSIASFFGSKDLRKYSLGGFLVMIFVGIAYLAFFMF